MGECFTTHFTSTPLHCTVPTTLRPTTPLHSTHYTLAPVLYCASLHLHYSTSLHCSVLCSTSHFTTLHVITLYCTVLHCTALLHLTVLHFTALHFTALCITTLHQDGTPLHVTARCNVLHFTSLVPHSTAPHCTVQYTSPYCTP